MTCWLRNLYNWPVYRRCLGPSLGAGSCGTAVAPRSTIPPTWATPGPSFLSTSCGESYRTISIMKSSIAWTSQILTTRCVDTDIIDLQGISGGESKNAQQLFEAKCFIFHLKISWNLISMFDNQIDIWISTGSQLK